MEVTYELSKSDISQLFRYIKNHRSQMRPIFVYAFLGVISIIMLALALLFLLRPLRTQADTPWSAFLMMLAGLALLTYSMFVRPLLAERKQQRDPRVVSQKTMQISATGVNVKHSLGEVTLHWPLIVDVVDDRDCYYLFLERNNALAVPKRAFSSRSEANSFYETARQNRQAAQNLTPPHQADQPATWPPAPRPPDAQEPGGGP